MLIARELLDCLHAMTEAERLELVEVILDFPVPERFHGPTPEQLRAFEEAKRLAIQDLDEEIRRLQKPITIGA